MLSVGTSELVVWHLQWLLKKPVKNLVSRDHTSGKEVAKPPSLSPEYVLSSRYCYICWWWNGYVAHSCFTDTPGWCRFVLHAPSKTLEIAGVGIFQTTQHPAMFCFKYRFSFDIFVH